MLRLSIPLRISGWKAPLAALLALGLAGPAAAGEVYAWRTDDGAWAFTDDQEGIPPRYRDRVEVRRTSKLADYPRFTPQDAHATARYEARLAAWLEHLRELNAQADRSETRSEAGAAPSQPRALITLRSGRRDRAGVDVTIPVGQGDEPIVTETVWIRPEGKAIAQPARVTRQGDRIISITKSRPREWDVMSDVIDEAELRAELEAE